MSQRADDLHHSSVATERENRVVAATALVREVRSMARPFRQRDIALDAAMRERGLGMRLTAPATTRTGIDDEEDALP
jgi:hypothetical protein